ncbi:hypothetical protein [Ornithobacterium rhinotracheale]|uniref:Uncharacterized protein n=1 Tax=Ornithobacterium rhinotracheale (strain ATCC 51463 / DSM 15997 / CCUG 23171 / CIP 104009 / LMG 9086) TaxID=867902 RepID=I4A368_ORNRL|nr:hypothetical protein [Ornithobacterium rhinotracheale]AFL98402.1 hypothetical protein Ornrh_2271 [Ornithobacterium rhinotracheale DSM 15997]AIQ00755.1 hypothetical protein Q785_11505 [Ornithobacterium rhinotracheale ORT-UMN 88]KGB65850.1 hypothetical protein Q787_11035 [Ornithobacterium rhinotracheale H06-030791]MBN3662837.1 hypothetical protein [Ornithobacterium rhinotracheale]MCK0193250.1 hypothetical protein [Ornithobacterium rhinotracheale]
MKDILNLLRLDSLYKFLPHVDRCLLHQKNEQTIEKYKFHLEALRKLGWNVPEFSVLREGEYGYFFARKTDDGFESEERYAKEFKGLYCEFLNLLYELKR